MAFVTVGSATVWLSGSLTKDRPRGTDFNMARLANTGLAAALLMLVSGCGALRSAENTPKVVTSDVHHFVAAFANWNPADTTCRSLQPYLQAASPGLKAYRDKFDMSPADLCTAVRRDPKSYAALQAKLPAIDSAQLAISAAYAKFNSLIPGATLPSEYFVVGDGISGGTTTGGRTPIVLIGAELLGSTKGLPVMTIHELVHTQQHYPALKVITGGPNFIRGTVLAQSVKEGSADFLAELVTGVVAAPGRDAYGDAHEREIWHDFVNDMHSKDYSLWIYNGRNTALGNRPSDLGYYVGYRITKAYYDRAANKSAAIHNILSIRDFDQFLHESGYSGTH